MAKLKNCDSVERLREFLIEADMGHYYDKLSCYGVLKVEHLCDMEREDFDALEMSRLERRRLIRHIAIWRKETKKPSRFTTFCPRFKVSDSSS